MKKIISPAIILALENALSLIYWYKNDLKRYLYVCIDKTEILSVIDWNDTKRNIVARIVGMLVKNESTMQDCLLTIIHDVSIFTEFDHLERLEDGKKKAVEAKKAVQTLKDLTKTFFQNKDEHEKYNERSKKANEAYNRINRQKQSLYSLKESFYKNTTQSNNQQRGYFLEKFLYNLFNIFDMDAKSSFKNTGEQIDGAFTFNNDEYLLEAKWQDKQTGIEDLYAFSGKVESKLDNTLGYFISMSGFSSDALIQFEKQKKVVLLMDSNDILAILDERISLDDLLMRKKKEAAHSGNIYYTITDILKK